MASAIPKRATVPFPAQHLSAWDILTQAIGDNLQPKPEGAITPTEVAERRKLSVSHSSHVLEDLVKAGKMKSVMYRTESGKRGKCYLPA